MRPAAFALLGVVLVAVSLVSEASHSRSEGEHEDVALPEEIYQNLDPVTNIQEAEAEGASADAAALSAMEHAAHEMEEAPKASRTAHVARANTPETFSQGGKPHEEQMDDLFGDMQKQQHIEEEQESQRQRDEERFAARNTGETRLANGDLGESNDLGESASMSASASATVTATAGSGAAAPVTAQPSLASPGAKLKPGKDEFQSYTTGHIHEEVQIGSENGLLAGSHGFTKGTAPKGRVILFGKKNGLYLENNQNTWSMYSNYDKESGGVCLVTAYNNAPTGLKVCHTSTTKGKWASGNVGITGNLRLEGKSTRIDVQRLHLFQTGIGPNGYVLKVGSAGPALAAGVSKESAWLSVSERKPLVINPGKGNVGFGTETPVDKVHVAGNMAVRNLYVASKKATLEPNRFTLKHGTGWYMSDSKWMRVIGNRGVEAQAGAYFGDKVGINFNWKSAKSKSKVRINDGKIAVTRYIGKNLKGVAYFYDDALGEGRVYARDFTKKKWAPMRWEAEAIIFNPAGKSPIAIGTRNPKPKYLLHIHGNNKIDGHIYVAKKMKVGGRAHVAHLHTPRLNVKDQRGKDGSGQRPADNVKEFAIGEYQVVGKSYELKPGGTNLRLGYWKRYCWMQMWPKGRGGSPLVLNGAGNSVGFGTTRPKTNIPGSGSPLLFHVDGNMLVTGNLIVKGEVSGQSMETETLLDVGFDKSAELLHHLNVKKPSPAKTLSMGERPQASHFADSAMHSGAISLSHVAATLTRSLQHHQNSLDEHEKLLNQHQDRMTRIEDQLLSLKA